MVGSDQNPHLTDGKTGAREGTDLPKAHREGEEEARPQPHLRGLSFRTH